MNRILSIDYGDKRIGLALSDILKIIAKPYKTINNISNKQIIDDINMIIKDRNIEKIIVGLPITLKGNYSEQTNKVLSFVKLLEDGTSVCIETYDERLSSIQAKKSLIYQGVKTGHNKSEIDKTAAAIFLQGYLDGQSYKK